MHAIDVGSVGSGAGEVLSNFTAFEFEFDGVHCSSMEGLIQSFKFECPDRQVQICQLSGLKAKRKGQRRKWWLTKKLFWKGQEIDRLGGEYQLLLDRAFKALATNESFQKALTETGRAMLTHSIGKNDPCFTVLTEDEFCSRLMALRDELRS